MPRRSPYYSLLFIVLLMGTVQAFFMALPREIGKHPVVNHLLEKPEASALLLIKNGETVIDRNSNTPLPLASISKIVIALVYAEEASKGTLNPEDIISLTELEKFYVDDENYQNWKALGEQEGWVNQKQVALKYIAQGTVRFSVNTNADFLLEHIGLANINKWLQEEGLSSHDPIFPFNASGIVCHNIYQLPQKAFLAKMDTLSPEAYFQEVLSIQNRLAKQPKNLEENILQQQKINNKTFLKIWSDRFSKSTASDYAKILHKLLQKEAMSSALRQQISFLFEEWAFEENPGLEEQLRHIGYKGGSTGFLLNTVLYIGDHNDNQAQVILFMNELSPKRHRVLSKVFSGFVFELATNDVFAKTIKEVLLSSTDTTNHKTK